jgi:PAS domain S-box-containing protein
MGKDTPGLPRIRHTSLKWASPTTDNRCQMAKQRPIRSDGLDGEAYPLLFESVDNMICTLDLEGRLTAVNRAGERLTGYTREELVGRSALDLIPPELRDHAARQFRARLTDDGERAPDESVLVAQGGRQIPI